MKLYPLQQSRKRRFAPGADAKEMNLSLFFSGRKALLSLQASKCYSREERRGIGAGGHWSWSRGRGKKTEKPNTRGKFTFLTNHCP